MKKYFFEVEYTSTDKDNNHQYFLIGYFSTLKNAKLAIEKTKDKPGFKNSLCGYKITRFAVNFSNGINKKDGITLYELSHEYQDDDGYDNITVWELFETRQAAENKLSTLRNTVPFSDHLDGFCIAKCVVDRIEWSEGFVSWDA